MLAAFARLHCSTLCRLANDRRGSIAVTVALAMTVLIGFAGAGVDFAMWETAKRDLQGAADQAAYSAAVAYGKAYSSCCICGRGLLNDESIARSMGPICADRRVW